MVRLVPLENDVIPWFYQGICISWRGLGSFCHVVWLGTEQFRWTIGTNGTIGTSRKSCHSNGCTGEYAEKGEFIHVMFNKRVRVFYQGIKPRGEAEWVIMKCPCFFCVRMSIKLIDCIPSPTGKKYYTVLFLAGDASFSLRFSKSALCQCLTRKKQRLLVIMFIPEFMCYIVQSISIAIISKFQRFFALM